MFILDVLSYADDVALLSRRIHDLNYIYTFNSKKTVCMQFGRVLDYGQTIFNNQQ